MSMTRAVAITASSLVKALRFGMIAVASVLLAGSIATSISRPAPPDLRRSAAPAENAALRAVQPPSPSVTAWRGGSGAWTADDSAVLNPDAEGVVPLLLRFEGLEYGKEYTIGIRYRTCAPPGAPGFDSLTSAPPLTSAMAAGYPATGRQRPDATIAVPPEHGAAEARISLWGGTFAAAARGTSSETCAGDAIVELPVRAHSNHLVLTFGGQVATGPSGRGSLPTVTGFISPAP